MKKLLLIAVLTLASGVFAADQYLYWMLPDAITLQDESGTPVSYEYARVGVMNNSSGENAGYLSLYGDGGEDYGTDMYWRNPDGESPLYAKIEPTTFGSGYSYYIELLNDSSTFVGRSTDMLSYVDVQKYLATFGTGAGVDASWVSNGSTFTTQAIPEPTSGLLLLLGVAGLALRRKNKKA